MSKSSNVGSSGVYEAGDQRTVPRSEVQHHPRYEEGKEGSHHSLDSKDQRTIANRLAAAGPVNDDTSRKEKTMEEALGEEDPTLPAKRHGHEPSKGAKIDKELQDEDAEMLAKKDAKKK